jgi:hypothetical protein
MTAPKHLVTVTAHGPHYYLDCTCGLVKQFASKRAANVAGRDHQEKTYAEVRK